jgi:hypothetical protein
MRDRVAGYGGGRCMMRIGNNGGCLQASDTNSSATVAIMPNPKRTRPVTPCSRKLLRGRREGL